MTPSTTPRDTRLSAIRGLLDTKEISSQSDLSDELAAQGIIVTQATLSRDLAALGATRIPSATGRRYSIPPRFTRSLDSEIITTVTEIVDAPATVVIRTGPGDGELLADFLSRDPAMAVLVVGAVGSSDTTIVALRHPYRAADLIPALHRRRATERNGVEV